MNVVFWNVNKRRPHDQLCRIVKASKADLLVLAECTVDAALTGKLLTDAGADFRLINTNAARVKVLCRTPGVNLALEKEASNWSILHVEPGANQSFSPFLVAVVHFPSRLHWSVEDLNGHCKWLGDDIRAAEHKRNHQRTLVVGDFNMNPFEQGMVDAHALHAVMSRDVAERESRTILRRSFTYFYNPMWRLMGDPLNGPGTYFYRKATPVQYFWHTFDQVLLRPALLSIFDDSSLRIVRHDGTGDIIIQGKAKASDHYPIQFSLNL